MRPFVEQSSDVGVGQEEPLTEVPKPRSKTTLNFLEHRDYAHTCTQLDVDVQCVLYDTYSCLMVNPRCVGAKTRWRQLVATAIILCSMLLGVGLARTQIPNLPVPLPQQQQQAAESADPAAQQLQTRTMKSRERCTQPDMDSEVHIVYASCGGGRCELR